MASILSDDDPFGIGSLFCETSVIPSSNKATVRPFTSHLTKIPAPPSVDDIASSQALRSGNYDDISASQLIANSRFKAPKGILKRKPNDDNTLHGHQSSQSSSFLSSVDDDLMDLGFPAMTQNVPRPFSNKSQNEVASEIHSLLQVEDVDAMVIPNSQPPRSSSQRFIPSFTSKKFRPMHQQQQTPQPSMQSSTTLNSSVLSQSVIHTPAAVSIQPSNSSIMSHSAVHTPAARPIHPHQAPYNQQMVADTPNTLNIPGVITPGGSIHGTQKLRSIDEIPESYRRVFPFPYFNIVQSKVLDDVLYSDRPMVVCAPTGAGKTVVFELAIVRLLIALGQAAFNSKIVYMAPIKVLCSQRCQEWKEKFEPLGLKCQELTGDTDIDDYFLLQTVNIVCTTPEKWDSMTRKWRDNKSLVQLVRLFLIDEVHSLNDECRGATVEAVVSRMKTVQAAVARENTNECDNSNPTNSILRFIAVSATIPNIEDVAEWLGNDGRPAIHHQMDDSYRPVKLRKVVLGFACSENQNEFRFDLSLNYKLSGVIQTYSDQKPTLVFCATRKGTQQAAGILVKEARFILNAQHKQRLQKCANMLRDSKLRDLVIHGVGFHHAGLDMQDRKAVEEIFVKGDLPVLMATSTLAMGVNLPAHLVIIKSTQHYVCSTYTDYSETQVLQMIGRAGRPQFDTSATAVIMTKNSTKRKYEMLLGGKENIESSLHNHLIEYLNAEVVLHTINDISIAIEWLKSTFLFVRIKKNSPHYGIPVGLSDEELEKRLQDMCIKDLNLLAQFRLVHMDGETMDLKPTETGRLMARYCIAFNTMQRFSKITGTETVEELIFMLADCKEFADIQLRVNERRTLNMLNKDKNRVTIRYPMNGKIKTTPMKVNCLVQATLGCLPIQDFALSQDCIKIFRVGQRTTRCLMEFLQQRADFKAFLNAAVIAKCFRARLWENSKFVAKQIDKIGSALAMALVNAGIISFHKMEETNPRELELIVNRHPPFGNQIQDAVIHLPKYDVSIEQVNKYQAMNAEILVTVSIMNQDALCEKQTAKSKHGCMLIIGDTDNNIVTKQRIMDSQILTGLWTRRIEVKRATKGEELSVNLISQEYVGLDVQSTYTPFYSGPKHLRATSSSSGATPISAASKSIRFDSPVDTADRSPNEISEYFAGRKPCSHRCTNKDTCAHDCCKFGVVIKTPLMSKGDSKNKKSSLPQLQMQSSATTRGHQEMSSKNGKLDGYISQLHAKTHHMPSTPALKRLKGNQDDNRDVNLKKFAYTPRGSLLRSNMTPATSQGGTTPNVPAVPATPSGKGWEHLDLYHQQRHQCQFQEDEQFDDDFQVSNKNPNEPFQEDSAEHGTDGATDILPSFDVDWSDIIQNEKDDSHMNPQEMFRSQSNNFNQYQKTTTTSSSQPRHQGKVFAWKSPQRDKTSSNQPHQGKMFGWKSPQRNKTSSTEPHTSSSVLAGNEINKENRSSTSVSNSRHKEQQSYSHNDFTSARQVMLNQAPIQAPVPRMKPTSQRMAPLYQSLYSQPQTMTSSHHQQQGQPPSCQMPYQRYPKPDPPSQHWSTTTPTESPEIVSINSSPMSLKSPQVIVLSDDGGDTSSVHSAGFSVLSSMSSPDDMLMKCVEAEEAKYSQEQLSPIMASSRCSRPSINYAAPEQGSSIFSRIPIGKTPCATKSFFTTETSQITDHEDVHKTFDNIFQGIF